MNQVLTVLANDSDQIEINKASVEELFNLYQSHNFIYPAKMERLKPVWPMVKQNWAKAIEMGFPMFWFSTVNHTVSKISGSGCAWRYLNKGMIGQHLTANYPVASRIILLGMLQKIIENQDEGFLDSFQIFFRPENKYPNKIFENVSRIAGPGLSMIVPYHYMEIPILHKYPGAVMKVAEINDPCNQHYIGFLKRERGDLFIKAQELDTTDLGLGALNSSFNLHGLHRKRKIFAAIADNNKMTAVLILNQSSLGLNFSFFENSCEIILCNDEEEKNLIVAATSLLQKATELMSSLPLPHIPVLVNPAYSSIIESLGGKIEKKYHLFIVLKGGYECWYEFVERITRDVFNKYNQSLL